MRFPRWLVRLIPRLAPRATWDDAVPVSDADYLDRCGRIYASMANRIRNVRPDAILHPVFARRVYVIDGPRLPRPYENQWAVAFPEHADGGNAGGNIVVLHAHRHNVDLIAHECAHLITGITDHPDWLFASGLALTV